MKGHFLIQSKRDAIHEYNRGSSQNKRLPLALKEGYVLIDDMSFETLIVMARDMASQLNFYDINGHVTGAWDKLFNDNEVFIMAMISTINLDNEQKEYNVLKTKPSLASIHYLLAKFTQFDLWYNKLVLNDNPAIYELKLKILSVIEKHLSHNLNVLLGLIEQLKIVIPDEWQGEKFNRIWDIDESSLFLDNHSYHSDEAYLTSHLELCFSAWTNSVNYLQSELNNYLSEAIKTGSQDPSIGLFFVFLKLFNKAQHKLNLFTLRHTNFYYEKLLQFSPREEIPESAYLTLTLASINHQYYSLPKGKLFTCGVDDKYNDITYQADETITVTDAKVEQICSLYLQEDSLVSPEHEMGYVTRISSSSHNANDVKKQASNLFGNDILEKTESLAVAVSSELLTLKEGVREITLTFGLGERYPLNSNAFEMMKKDNKSKNHQVALIEIVHQIVNKDTELFILCQSLGGVKKVAENVSTAQSNLLFTGDFDVFRHQIYKVLLLSLFTLTDQESTLHLLLGKIFSRHILHKNTWLKNDDITIIKTKLESELHCRSLHRLIRLFEQDKLRTFYELYHNMFDINVSTNEGWKAVDSYVIQPLTVTNDDIDDHYGLTFNILLKQDFPEIIVPEQPLYASNKKITAPTLRFSIKPQSTFFPYSIFRELGLNNVAIHVEVKGVTELLAYNQHGRLDLSKPFTPLGPQPSIHSYLVFSNDEIAHKPLLTTDINIDWAELPRNHGGFGTYYSQYDNEYTNDTFKLSLLTIRNGQWNSIGSSQHHADDYPMFNTDDDSEKLTTFSQYSMNLVGLFNPIKRKTNNLIFDYDIKTRNGFFKLCLSAPDYTFGHQEYPNVLTNALLKNAKTKKEISLPPVAYTPQISRMTLNYQAATVINLQQLDHEQSIKSEQVIHIHPFGYEQIYPITKTQNKTLFPRYMNKGNLFLGLSASKLEGRLSLFFHLDEKAEGKFGGLSTDSQAEIQWYYLFNNQWIKFKNHQVISDTSNGFLTSGIVTLDIPSAINTGNTIMPAPLFWLRASTDRDIANYGNYFSVNTHGIKLTRQSTHNKNTLEERYHNETINNQWQPLNNTPQLGDILQKTPFFGARLAQTTINKQAISERLRHKNRAVNSWDYERLILEQFPHIEYVNCLANTRLGIPKKCPGHILIVVRRNIKTCQHKGCDNYKVGADEIRKIQQFIQKKVPSFVHVDVCSPEYEQVQVRCHVVLADNEHQGITLRRLNNEISNQLCPWNEQGMNEGIASTLNLKQLESFIRQLSYVKFVTDFSLLHILPSTKTSLYQLKDTALNNVREISPSQSWKILMPVTAHAIDVGNNIVDIPPEVTGISELKINQNFIIGNSQSAKPNNDKTQGQSNG